MDDFLCFQDSLLYRVVGKSILKLHGFLYMIFHIYCNLKIMLTPALFFKCLSDETRLRCVTLLQKEGKLCVCELTEALQLSQPKISRHLAQLRQCGLLLDSREGQWVFYQINPKLPDWALSILENSLLAVEKNGPYSDDYNRLSSMADRPDQAVCR